MHRIETSVGWGGNGSEEHGWIKRPLMQREVSAEVYNRYKQLRQRAHLNGFWVNGVVYETRCENEVDLEIVIEVIHNKKRTECEDWDDAERVVDFLINGSGETT